MWLRSRALDLLPRAVWLMALGGAAAAANAATIVVTSNAPTGPNSLNAAILAAESATEPTTIVFDLGVNNVIRPTGVLWSVFSNHPVTIDGGGSVVISGEDTEFPVAGLSIDNDGHTLRGLTIVNFAIGILVNGADSVIENCFIGTDGVSGGAGNVLGNGIGIQLTANAQNVRIGAIGAGNVISGNANFGIAAEDVAGLRIIGNTIGLNAAGTMGIPNGGPGIRVQDGADLTIGGAAAGAGNVIAANLGGGMFLLRCSATLVENNTIGFNAARNGTILNAGNSIFFSLGPQSGSVIRGNVIAGGMRARSSPGLAIQGNWFGVNGPAGEVFTVNDNAISVDASAGPSTNLLIGGEDAGNVIAGHLNWGIQLSGAGTNGVRISRNSIFGNTSGGIQLSSGANNGMPAPGITGLDPVAGVTGPAAQIEFFADDGGQGRFYLGTVQANELGNFSAPFLNLEPHGGRNLTAIAISTDGDASPFSEPVAIPASGGHTADQNGDNVIQLGELLRVIQFFNSGGFHCAIPASSTEDGYAPGPNLAQQACAPHASDYNPQNWEINLSELLRLIQFFNSGGYFTCAEGEDGYCPGSS